MAERRAPIDIQIVQPVSYWPALAALGALLLAIGLTTSTLVAGGAVLILLVALAGWARELEVEELEERAWDVEREQLPLPWWEKRSKQWWGAVALTFASFFFFVGAFRAFLPHGGFLPENWPAPARDMVNPLTLGMTGVLLLSGFAARQVSKAAAPERPRTLIAELSITLGLGTAFLAGLALQYWNLSQAGFTLDATPLASLFYWTTGLHAVHVIAGLVFLVFILLRTERGELPPEHTGAARAAVIFWYHVIVVWIVIYLLVYAKVLPVDFTIT